MKLSIIVPVYNVEKYLEACLDSLLNQDIDKYEIICINDGSTDNSLDILEKYGLKYSFIKIINQKNKGLSEARNTGLLHSKGQYILFVDSDDLLFPKVLKQLFQEAIKKNIDILDFNAFSFKGSTEKKLYFQDSPISSKPLPGKEYFKKYIEKYKKQPFVSAWTHLYRREFLINNDLNFISGILYEDLPFTAKAYLLANYVVYKDINVYKYRYSEGSITKGKIKIKNITDLIKVSGLISDISKQYKVNIPMDNFVSGHKRFIMELLRDSTWYNYKSLYEDNIFIKTNYHLSYTKNKFIVSISKLNFNFFILFCKLLKIIK